MITSESAKKKDLLFKRKYGRKKKQMTQIEENYILSVDFGLVSILDANFYIFSMYCLFHS
jgi:hypothetical protein